MADWTRLNILPSNAPASDVLAPRNRALQDTSGNIQTYAPDVKHDGEGLQYNGQSINSGYPCIQPVHHQLPSNDNTEKIQRLQWRRSQRQRYHHDGKSPGALWAHERYKKYRDRSERGKQRHQPSEEVWPERVEQAFYDALMNIPCYGRKKKSQNNRPHGRNELIALWIKKATGVERSRKQISSHIQVLKTKMKGIPEWDKVSIPQNDDNSLNGPTNRYYSNSIEDDVKNFYGNSRCNNNLQSRGVPGLNSRLSLPCSSFDANAAPHVFGLNFKMWVSPKDHKHFRERSWDYTCSADDQGSPSAPPMNLESVLDWRHSFPDLTSIIANHSSHVKFDIILISAGLKLMEDHPPPQSKLGLNLELDLCPRSNSRDASLAQTPTLGNWRGITHIYRYGHPVEDHEPSQFSLCEPTSGKLNTSFESRWWAKQFTLLTECRREAEDSCSDAKLAAADERIRQFFDGTTAMQEFRADSNTYHRRPGAVYPAAPDASNTVILLLWKFHQVHGSKVGTTSWQSLVPAPDRNTTNSPHPGEDEMSLLPLVIDSRLSSNLELQHQHSPYHDASDNYPIYPDTLPNPDFMPAAQNFDFFRPEEDLVSFHPSSFDLPMSDLPIADLDASGACTADFSQTHHIFDFPPPDADTTVHPLSYRHGQATSSGGPLPPPTQLHHQDFSNELDTAVPAAAVFSYPQRHHSHRPVSPTGSTSSSPSLPRRLHRQRPVLAELAHHVRETHDTLQASLAGPANTANASTLVSTATISTEAMAESAAVVMVTDEEIRAAIAGLGELGAGAMMVGAAQQQQTDVEHGDSRGRIVHVQDRGWVDVIELADQGNSKVVARANGEQGEGENYQENRLSKVGEKSCFSAEQRIEEIITGEDAGQRSDLTEGEDGIGTRVRTEADFDGGDIETRGYVEASRIHV